MTQKIYQVDAFTDKLFAGNPAAVCPLEYWLEEELMQNIARENNLAETAFFVKEGEKYHIRWFTPSVEVDLCGHATLATAFVLFNFEHFLGETIHFYSKRSGNLSVKKDGEYLIINFPADSYQEMTVTQEIMDCFDIPFKEKKIYHSKSDFYLIEFMSEKEIKNAKPNFNAIKALKNQAVIITAKGEEVDFVSRFFAPNIGVNEDPVTGAAHTTLIPFWAKKLKKNKLSALQLSERGGKLRCEFLENRVEISGQAKLYMKGEIFV